MSVREKPLILIVDDEESFREIMSVKLKAGGFDVIAAENETEAFKKAKQFLPDLILMDIFMPGGTGTDAALMIKQDSETKNVKIAFLTNLKEPWPGLSGDNQKISQELGMIDFLEKTEDLNLLMEKIKKILNLK